MELTFGLRINNYALETLFWASQGESSARNVALEKATGEYNYRETA